MASTCNACSQSRTPVARSVGQVAAATAQTPEVVVYTATQDAVRGRRNKRFPLNQPLVPPHQFPRGKWGVWVKAKGFPKRIEGTSAAEVFRAAKALFVLNGEEISDLDLWLNLNLQWVPRVPNKYQLVTPADLIQIAKPL